MSQQMLSVMNDAQLFDKAEDFFSRYRIKKFCNVRGGLPAMSGTNQNDRKQTVSTVDFSSWPLDLLASYIEKEHHRYLKEQMPLLFSILRQIRKTQVRNDRNFRKITILFTQVSLSLSAHMNIEETIVFPFIKALVAKNGEVNCSRPLGYAFDHFFQLSQDHEQVLDMCDRIRAYSHDYTTLPGKEHYGVLELLRAFHEDLYFHIQIESNVLFPEAFRLYERYKTLILSRAQAPPRL